MMAITPEMGKSHIVKTIVQYARYLKDERFLEFIPETDRQEARSYLQKLDEPLLIRNMHQPKNCPRTEFSPQIYMHVFAKPEPSDRLISIAVESLVKEFFDYLERAFFVIIRQEEGHEIILESFEKLNYDMLFWNFLISQYSDDNLTYRWSLVKALYNLKPYFDPFKIKNSILKNKIPLETPESPSLFNDNSIRNCLFCGREIVDDKSVHKVMGGFASFASQKPQSDIKTQNAIVCSICLFASCVSLIRTSNPQGLGYAKNIVLVAESGKEQYESVFNRLIGISVGSFFTMKNAETSIDKYGETTVTHLVASTAPIELLQDQHVNLISGASENPLDKRKIIAIKSFEELIGFRKMYKPSDESCFRKIHYDILRGNFFSIFGHLAGLSNRKELIDNGIYRLVRYGVIELDDARIVFGSALLIDAFLPKSWKNAADDAKTDTRKVAYYLDQPEEVLYRLRKISDETTSINKTFSNEASYKLLKELLQAIYEEEHYGAFQEKIKQNDLGQEYMRLSLDDVLKVYLYIREYLLKRYKDQDENKMNKTYSDFMAKIKYALVARRPELVETGGK
ncbi:MAG: hypothetical protein ACBZ72_05825 [Candidatus Bathyarchaeia archaeon]|jgi:hypothetical protein